eukprot:m.331695 g.331695  ORF g.331695 m.331695 type:complete len:154 (+) comp20483_c1_seq14:984-1445(+)
MHACSLACMCCRLSLCRIVCVAYDNQRHSLQVNLISQQFALKFQVEFYIPNSLFDQLKANDDLRHERLFSFMNAVEIMEGPTVSVLANPKENGQIVKVLTKVKFEQHFDQSHFPWDMHDFTVQGATWLLSASVSIISTMTSSKEPFGSGYMLC